jgi:hypothetical protein
MYPSPLYKETKSRKQARFKMRIGHRMEKQKKKRKIAATCSNF